MRGLERAIEKLPEAAGRERDEIGDLASAQAPELEREAQEFAEAGQSATLQVRRRLHEKWLEMACEAAESLSERQEPLAIRRGESEQEFAHPFTITPPGQNFAIRRHCLDRRLRRDHAQSVPIELKIADDFRTQHARHVCGSRNPAAGSGHRVDLLGDTAAA